MNIRELRKKAGITQEELALETGLQQGYISELENNVKTNPSIKVLTLISKVLDCTVGELLGEKTK